MLESSCSCCQCSVLLWKKEDVTHYAVNPANGVSNKIMKNILLKNSTLFLFATEIPLGGGGGRVGLCFEQELAILGVHTTLPVTYGSAK